MNTEGMNSMKLYDKVSIKTSRLTTRTYSTSFSFGINCLDKELRNPIYAIYGFVRFADEIVDTFHEFDKKNLLQRFKEETWRALEEGVSLNPILHSFQSTVRRYRIDRELIESFLTSMEMDLTERKYDRQNFEKYVLGSAEVVGLMCLRVFCDNDDAMYDRLRPAAMKLGSAFQKINFLRDLHADYDGLGRSYFPGVPMDNFNEASKQKIESEIAADFAAGYEGIRGLPRKARLGVYVAYLYYKCLFRKIQRYSPEYVLSKRVRLRNRYKLAILGYSYLRHQFNLL